MGDVLENERVHHLLSDDGHGGGMAFVSMVGRGRARDRRVEGEMEGRGRRMK